MRVREGGKSESYGRVGGVRVRGGGMCMCMEGGRSE